MPMIFVAAVMLAQAAAQPAPIVVNKKKEQVCEYVDVSGSRMRQRVCHDRGAAPANHDAEAATGNAGMFHAAPPAPAPPSFGESPH